MNDPGNTFKIKVGRIAASLLIGHILLAGITLIGSKKFTRSNPITLWYSKLAIIGPFFSTDRIKSSYHLYVSVKEGETWTKPRDHGTDAFHDYCMQPWRYSRLREYDLEGNLAWRANSTGKSIAGGMSKSFRELSRYVSGKLLKDITADSVRLDYVRRTYQLNSNTFHLDTVFSCTYDPTAVE